MNAKAKIKLMKDYSTALTNQRALERAKREAGTEKEWLPWDEEQAAELEAVNYFISKNRGTVEAICSAVEGTFECSTYNPATSRNVAHSVPMAALVRFFFTADASGVPDKLLYGVEWTDEDLNAITDAIGRAKI